MTRAQLMQQHRPPVPRCVADLDPLEPVGTETTGHGVLVHRRVARWPRPGWVAACGPDLCAFTPTLASLEVRCCQLCPTCWPIGTSAGSVPVGTKG